MNRKTWEKAWRMIRCNRGAIMNDPPADYRLLLAARVLIQREMGDLLPKNRLPSRPF
jgi:hypothetical protein